MHERQPVHENRHIIAIRVCRRILPCVHTARHRILIDDLQTVVVDMLLVNQTYILCCAIVTFQILNMVRLDAPCLRCDAVARGAIDVLKKRSHSASVNA